MRDEEIRKFQEIGDDALKLMLKLGDPGPNEKYEGKEVDFEQFMTLMERPGSTSLILTVIPPLEVMTALFIQRLMTQDSRVALLSVVIKVLIRAIGERFYI